MAENDIKHFYDATVEHQAFMSLLEAALSPGATGLNLSPYQDMPGQIFGPFEADQMRSSPTYREKIYDTQITLLTLAALHAIEDAARTEIDFFAFCTARAEYIDTHKAGTKETDINAAALAASRERLAGLNGMIDHLHDDAEDEPNWIENHQKTHFKKLKAAHLERLHRGLDSRVMHDFFVRKVAGDYIRAADAFVESAIVHAGVTVIRLEVNPMSYGEDVHVSAMRNFSSEMNVSKAMATMATKVCPSLLQPPAPRSGPKLKPN